MYSLYPNVGVELALEMLDTQNYLALKKKLPNNCIIHLYGLSATGKTSIAELLMQALDAHCIDESLITEVIAYATTIDPRHYDTHNLKYYFQKLSFEARNHRYIPYFDTKVIPRNVLKTKKTQIVVNKLLADKKYWQCLNEYCIDALNELHNSRVIVLSNFAQAPYLTLDAKRVTIGFLLQADSEEVMRRWFELQKKLVVLQYPDAEESVFYQQVEEGFEKFVLDRDAQLLEYALHENIAIISDDSYVVNTTYASIDLIAGSILNALYHIVDETQQKR